MTTRFPLNLQSRGFEECYSKAAVHDTSNQPLGEATSEACGGAWARRTPELSGHLAFDSRRRARPGVTPGPACLYPCDRGACCALTHACVLRSADRLAFAPTQMM